MSTQGGSKAPTMVAKLQRDGITKQPVYNRSPGCHVASPARGTVGLKGPHGDAGGSCVPLALGIGTVQGLEILRRRVRLDFRYLCRIDGQHLCQTFSKADGHASEPTLRSSPRSSIL